MPGLDGEWTRLFMAGGYLAGHHENAMIREDSTRRHHDRRHAIAAAEWSNASASMRTSFLVSSTSTAR
jgi:hypothetical protein